MRKYTKKEAEARKHKNPWCGNCTFFCYIKDNPAGLGYFGNCLRFPPTRINKEGDSAFPVVYSNYNLCGEYKRGRCILR